MPSPVYFADLRAGENKNLMDKLDILIRRVDLKSRQKPGGLTAVKIHFGEKGNTSFIRPVYVRRFVEAVKAAGAAPFITDCNTLYVGTRSQSAGHLTTALENGFAPSVVGAPLIISDGLKGHNSVEVAVDLPECATAHIGGDIVEADAVVSLSPFQGTRAYRLRRDAEESGHGLRQPPGQALSAQRRVAPTVKAALCVACGECIKRCPTGAIRLAKRAAGDPPAPQKSKNPQLSGL